jgi:hypothetical protein
MVNPEVGIEIGAEVGIATAGESRRTDLIVKVFRGFEVGIGGFEVRVASSGNS